MSFKFDSKDLEKGLEIFQDKATTAVRMYAETSALKLEAHAKDKAPWTDRTGEARKRLKGTVERKSLTVFRIKLAHGVDYGKWLELAHSKRFAIIAPTINLKSQEIFNGLDRLLDRMG